MAGYSTPHLTYAHAVRFGFDIRRIFDLPHPLMGVHQGAINRLSADGIIKKAGRAQMGNTYRYVWVEGPRFPTFRDWCRRNGKI